MKTCWIHQFFMSSALDRGSVLPWLTRRHLDDCAICRSVWLDLKRVHGLLNEKGSEIRHAAGKVPMTVGRPKIQDEYGLRREKETKVRRVPAWRPLMALAAAATVLMMIIGIRWIRPMPDDAGERQGRVIEEVRGGIGSWKETLTMTSLEDPLERELQGLIGTARSAAGYLKHTVKKATGLSENGG